MDEQKRELAEVWKEYEQCSRLEQELGRTRWTFFTAILSVSLVVGGLALKQTEAPGAVLGKAGFAFGWLIFLAGYYHYWWFHKILHKLRDHLCELERKPLEIRVYIIRGERPQFGFLRHYHWAIDLLALAYTLMLIFVLGR